MFSQAVIEKLGFYVYFLKDPRNDMVFYVGKGRGNRVFNHMICALDTDSGDDRGMDEKLETIREITGSGHEVQHYILRHDLDEKSAFEIEASLIDWVLINCRISKEAFTQEILGSKRLRKSERCMKPGVC